MAWEQLKKLLNESKPACNTIYHSILICQCSMAKLISTEDITIRPLSAINPTTLSPNPPLSIDNPIFAAQ